MPISYHCIFLLIGLGDSSGIPLGEFIPNFGHGTQLLILLS